MACPGSESPSWHVSGALTVLSAPNYPPSSAPPPKPNAPTFSNPMLPPFHPLYRVMGGPTAALADQPRPSPAPTLYPWPPHTDPWPCGPAVSQYTAAWRVLGPNPPPGMSVGAPTVLSAPNYPPSSAPPPEAQRPYLLQPHAPTISPLVQSNGRPHGRSGRPTSPLPCTNPIPLAPHADPWPCGPAVIQYTAAWRVLGSDPPPGMSVGATTVLSAPNFPPSSAPPQKPNAPTFSNPMHPPFHPLYRVMGGPTAALADQPRPSPAPTLYPWPPMLIPGRVAQLQFSTLPHGVSWVRIPLLAF